MIYATELQALRPARAHAPESPFDRALRVCEALFAGRSFTVYEYQHFTGVSLATAKRDLQGLRRIFPKLRVTTVPSEKGALMARYSLQK